MTRRLLTPEAIIDAYVRDVIRNLPRRMRNDIGFELRALLAESLRDRAAEAGRPPDETMAVGMVRDFGTPEAVAERYHPPGQPIIPARQTPGFAWATVLGVGLQWAISLPLALSGQLAPGLPESARFTAWWLSYGLGAFWWPGFLVSVMLAAAWVRSAWPARTTGWKPAADADPDAVNRTLQSIGLGLALSGIALWVLIAWAVTTFDTPVTRALEFAPDFLATRAPALLVFWAAGIVLMVVLIAEGRWRDLTRRIDLGLKLAACVLMLWFAAGGRIFVSDAADQTTKTILVMLILLVLGQMAAHAWRLRRRIRPPEIQRG